MPKLHIVTSNEENYTYIDKCNICGLVPNQMLALIKVNIFYESCWLNNFSNAASNCHIIGYFSFIHQCIHIHSYKTGIIN